MDEKEVRVGTWLYRIGTVEHAGSLATGEFDLTVEDGGRLSISAAGYHGYEGGVPEASMAVLPGGPLVIRLAPLDQHTVEVVDPFGDPVAGAEVWMAPTEGSKLAGEQWEAFKNEADYPTWSRPDGAYVYRESNFAFLGQTNSAGWLDQSFAVAEQGPVRFRVRRDAQWCTSKRNLQTLQVPHVTLCLRPTTERKGRLRWESGAPVSFARLELMRAGPGALVQTDRDGYFPTSHGVGQSLWIHVQRPVKWSALLVPSDSDSSEWRTVTLPDLCTARGRVVDYDGDLGAITVEAYQGGQVVANADVDSDGGFVLSAMQGSALLRFGRRDSIPLNVVGFAEVVLPSEAIELAPIGSESGLVLQVDRLANSKAVAQIYQPRDSQRESSFEVWGAWREREVAVAADGLIQLTGIKPGPLGVRLLGSDGGGAWTGLVSVPAGDTLRLGAVPYGHAKLVSEHSADAALSAWSPILGPRSTRSPSDEGVMLPPGPWLISSSGSRQSTSAGQWLELLPDQTFDLHDLSLELGTLVGTVLEGGIPVPALEVRLEPVTYNESIPGAARTLSTVTSVDGEFRFESQAFGEVVLCAYREGDEIARQIAQVDGDESTTITLDILTPDIPINFGDEVDPADIRSVVALETESGRSVEADSRNGEWLLPKKLGDAYVSLELKSRSHANAAMSPPSLVGQVLLRDREFGFATCRGQFLATTDGANSLIWRPRFVLTSVAGLSAASINWGHFPQIEGSPADRGIRFQGIPDNSKGWVVGENVDGSQVRQYWSIAEGVATRLR